MCLLSAMMWALEPFVAAHATLLRPEHRLENCHRFRTQRQAIEDRKEVTELFKHFGIGTNFKNCRRLGKFNKESKFPRAILVEMLDLMDKLVLLASLFKLKDYNKKVFISKSLSKCEQTKEQTALKERRRLIDEKQVNRSDLRIIIFLARIDR